MLAISRPAVQATHTQMQDQSGAVDRLAELGDLTHVTPVIDCREWNARWLVARDRWRGLQGRVLRLTASSTLCAGRPCAASGRRAIHVERFIGDFVERHGVALGPRGFELLVTEEGTGLSLRVTEQPRDENRGKPGPEILFKAGGSTE